MGWIFRSGLCLDSSSRARMEEAGREGVVSTMRW